VAREAFEADLARQRSAEALDGLGRALWWLKDASGALEARTQAYTLYREEGRTTEAALVAVWLAREYRRLFANAAVADGWLARAETLAEAAGKPVVDGWIMLAKAEADPEVRTATGYAREALRIAGVEGDVDLEIVSLARLALLEVARGEVDAGIRRLDESMAAASGGEGRDLQSVGDAYCALMEAADLLGDNARVARWSEAIAVSAAATDFGPLETSWTSSAYTNLSAFCGACCGGLYLVTHRLDDAEAELLKTIEELEAAGMQSRCVHPVAQLAELRILQGRLEEARSLLERFEDLPESVRPLAMLDLALGSPADAAARLRARIGELSGLAVVALPLRALLVDAHLALGELEGAAARVSQIEEVARSTQSNRHRAEALLAEGKLAVAGGHEGGSEKLKQAARIFSDAALVLPACRARLELARSLAERDRGVAISEARAALAAFERLGATPDADAAAAFLRTLGVKGRTGPKDLEVLSKREVEVLRLISQGLSNAEIAERLFISVKTAGHHVSNILSKLGLRSRTEAAAFAALNLPREPVPK
jgi:ATP/maltotriose-dependent transcriptional regulator MalT